MANSTSPWPEDRRLRCRLTGVEMVEPSRAAVPGDTVLSTPSASIDAISVLVRLQRVKSWLHPVTERRCRLGSGRTLPGRAANQHGPRTCPEGRGDECPEVLA